MVFLSPQPAHTSRASYQSRFRLGGSQVTLCWRSGDPRAWGCLGAPPSLGRAPRRLQIPMTGPDSSYNCLDAYDLAYSFENSLMLQISPVLQMAELFVDFLWKFYYYLWILKESPATIIAINVIDVGTIATCVALSSGNYSSLLKITVGPCNNTARLALGPGGLTDHFGPVKSLSPVKIIHMRLFPPKLQERTGSIDPFLFLELTGCF